MRVFLFTTLTAAIAASTALAQTPTPAQQQAIKSNCVADYRANCAGVPTGGMDALICLEQHEAKLSPACKSAVEAVDQGSGSSATAAKTTTASSASESGKAATAESSAAAGAQKPASGQSAMSLRQEMRIAARACARDYRVLCPNLPVGQGNVIFCLKVHADRLSPHCRKALVEAGEVF